MDKDKYYQLFHPQEILRIKQEDFILLYEETLKETSIDEKKCKLLKVALYQQLEYLNQNEDEKNKILNYIGSKNLQGK